MTDPRFQSDTFGAHVTFNVEESLILLSDEIYSSDRGLAMPVPKFQMALKSVEQFMGEFSVSSTISQYWLTHLRKRCLSI